MFKPIEKSTMAAFEVTKVIVDIVYGKYVPITKVTQVQIARKNSILFLENENTRRNSGSPGYI